MVGSGLAVVGYRSGVPGDPPGRFELTLWPDGGVRLEHRQAPGVRAWGARVEQAVWPRLLDAIQRSGQAALQAEPIIPRTGRRELVLDPLGHLAVEFGDSVDAGLGEALRILDALVRQVSGGAVRSTADELVQVVHWCARDTSLPERTSEAARSVAFGTVGGRHAYVRGGPGIGLFAVPDESPLGSSVRAEASIRAVALGRVGGRELLAAGGDDKVITVWDAVTGETVHARTGHRGPVSGVAAGVVAGRAVVFSASADGDVRVWAGDAADDLGAVSGWEGAFTDVCHARVAGLDLICAGGDDGVVRVWNAATAESTHTLGGHAGWVNAVAMVGLGDRGLVASGGADRVVRVWDLSDGRELRAFEGHTGSVTGVAFTTAGDRPVAGSCSLDGTVRTWDVLSGEALTVRPAEGDWPAAIHAVSGARRPAFVTAAMDGSVRIWDAVTGALLASLAGDSAASDVAAVETGGRVTVAAGFKDGSLRLWADGEPVRTVPPAGAAITAVAIGPGGLVVGTDDGTVRVHDTETGDELRTATPHTAPVLSLAFAEDILVSGGADAVRTWDALTGAPAARLPGSARAVAVAAGRIGERTLVAAAGYDGAVRVWDTVTARPLPTLHGQTGPVAFGARFLAATSEGMGTVGVWNPVTGERVALLPGDGGPIRALCFGADDELAVAAEDGTVRVWRLPAGELLGEFDAAETPLAVSFADGEVYAAGAQGLITLTRRDT